MVVELHALIRETIFIIVDDSIAHLEQIAKVLKEAKRTALPVVIIAGARTNEWNVGGAELVPHLKHSYDLLDLTSPEVNDLVSKLRHHKCLGYMEAFSNDEAVAYLRSKLNNQLLVALHEATTGSSFSEIVASEYLNIVPTEAQKLYLDICTVHRVGVPIRAGTISRIAGIRIEDFREKLFKPLEHVVQAVYSSAVGDYVYKTRHPKIAEIVFDNAVADEIARADQLVRIIGNMNSGYSSDDEAITRLIKSKDIAREFSNKELAYQIYRSAASAGINAESIDQHLAQFEALHKSGDLRKALRQIDEAIEESRDGKPTKSTLHVKALILRRLAREVATTQVERDKRRQEARAILDRLISDKRDPHPFNAKATLLLDELDERLGSGTDHGDNVVADLIRDIQATLTTSRQLFPRDAFIAGVESRFATMMEQHPRAIAILELAHKVDPHSPFLAIRLAQKYGAEGRFDEAIAVLAKTLKVGGPNKEVHLAMAEALLLKGERENSAAISDHLKRSFNDGDSRYRAKYLFARHEFLFGDRERAIREFASLSQERIAPGTSGQTRDTVCDANGMDRRYSGEVNATPRETFAFIRCMELGCDIFVRRKEVGEAHWGSLMRGSRVEFSLAFSFRGPQALNVHLLQ